MLARLYKSLAPGGVSLAHVTALVNESKRDDYLAQQDKYLARQSTENGAGTITSMLRQVRVQATVAVRLSGHR